LFAKNFFGIFLSYIIFSGNYWNVIIINNRRLKCPNANWASATHT
jgi:hypothetical protein